MKYLATLLVSAVILLEYAWELFNRVAAANYTITASVDGGSQMDQSAFTLPSPEVDGTFTYQNVNYLYGFYLAFRQLSVLQSIDPVLLSKVVVTESSRDDVNKVLVLDYSFSGLTQGEKNELFLELHNKLSLVNSTVNVSSNDGTDSVSVTFDEYGVLPAVLTSFETNQREATDSHLHELMSVYYQALEAKKVIPQEIRWATVCPARDASFTEI